MNGCCSSRCDQARNAGILAYSGSKTRKDVSFDQHPGHHVEKATHAAQMIRSHTDPVKRQGGIALR